MCKPCDFKYLCFFKPKKLIKCRFHDIIAGLRSRQADVVSAKTRRRGLELPAAVSVEAPPVKPAMTNEIVFACNHFSAEVTRFCRFGLISSRLYRFAASPVRRASLTICCNGSLVAFKSAFVRRSRL